MEWRTVGVSEWKRRLKREYEWKTKEENEWEETIGDVNRRCTEEEKKKR